MTAPQSEPARQAQGDDAIAVLLVDDQRFIGMAVARLLAGEPDIRLHCCYAATEAIAQANQQKPAVIFQDLQMPDLDGLTLVGLYRTNPQTAKTPIIVLSGNDDAASRAKSLVAGADDYLVKLPNKAALVACIRRHAGGQPAVAIAAAPLPSVDADVTFDRAIVDAFRESAAPHGAALVAMVIHQFLEEATLLVGRITAAALVGDEAALKLSAHSLKGTALMIGARRLGRLAGKVEEDADRPDSTIDPALVSSIDEELGRVRADCLLETEAV